MPITFDLFQVVVEKIDLIYLKKSTWFFVENRLDLFENIDLVFLLLLMKIDPIFCKWKNRLDFCH